MKSQFRDEYERPRLITHLDRLAAWQQGKPFFPVTVEISPSARCNQLCTYCYASFLQYPNFQIERDVLLRLVRELASLEVRTLVFAGTGEPLLNLAAPDAMVAAKEAGIPSVFLVTNGVLLGKKVTDRLLPALTESDIVRISAFESDATRYAEIHGCKENQFRLLTANMEEVARYRSQHNGRFAFGATVYPFKNNVGHVYESVRMARDMGLDFVTVGPPALLTTNTEQEWPRDLRQRHQEELRRVPELETETFMVNVNQLTFDALEKQPELERYGCNGIDFYAHIAADARVYPCFRYWFDEGNCYGDLKEQSFAAIWQGAKRQEVRRRVLECGRDSGKCANCTETRINKTLWQLAHPSRFANYI